MDKSKEDDGSLAETRRIMARLVNTPPKPHDQMALKRKDKPKPEKRMAGKGRAPVGKVPD